MTMTDRYGPQTEHVQQLIERLTVIPPRRARGLFHTARSHAWNCPDAVQAAAHASYRAASYSDAHTAYAAYAAAHLAAGDRCSPYAVSAAANAAHALATRHLVGTAGYTREHYRLLVEPVATAVGPLHPED